jgi:hypothetical protein
VEKENKVKVPKWITGIFRIAAGSFVILLSMGLSHVAEWVVKTIGNSNISENAISLFVVLVLAYIIGTVFNKITGFEGKEE